MAGRRFLSGLLAPFITMDDDYEPVLSKDVATRGWSIQYIQNNIAINAVTINASYNVTNEDIIFVDGITTDITITMPNPNSYSKAKTIKIVENNNHDVKIITSSGTIEDENEIILWINKTSIDLIPYTDMWGIS